jgi:hypothetical protein
MGILPHGVWPLSFPFASGTRFSRSIPKPVSSSCRLYTDCRRDRKQVPSRLIPEHMHDSGFDSTLEHFRFSSRLPCPSFPPFSAERVGCR